MQYRIRIYTGLTIQLDDGKSIAADPDSTKRESLERLAADTFGGVTVYDHVGVWRNGRQLVRESGLTFEILAADPFIGNPDIREDLRQDAVKINAEAFTRDVRRTLQQESVLLTVEPIRDAEFIGD